MAKVPLNPQVSDQYDVQIGRYSSGEICITVKAPVINVCGHGPIRGGSLSFEIPSKAGEMLLEKLAEAFNTTAL